MSEKGKSEQDEEILIISPGQLTRKVINQQNLTKRKIQKQQTCRLRIYLNELKINKRCFSYLTKCFKKVQYKIFLKWSVYDFEGSCTSTQVKKQKVYVTHTKSYEIQMTSTFLDHLKKKPLTIKIFARSIDETVFIGRAKYMMQINAEVNHTKQDGKMFFENQDIDPEATSVVILNISYRFDFDHNVFNDLCIAASSEIKVSDKHLSDGPSKVERVDDLNKMGATKSEIEIFYDSVLLLMNKNKTLRTTQEELTEEVTQKVIGLHSEANWKKTLQERAILSGDSPNNVLWRQWRTSSTHDLPFRTFYEKPPTYSPRLDVLIISLKFPLNGSVLLNPAIEQIYVEYTFLNFEGPEFETPNSYPIQSNTNEISINFQKTFLIDEEEHLETCMQLALAIQRQDSIRFAVVNEPVEKADRGIQTCNEIGFALANLNRLIMHKENKKAFDIPVLSNVCDDTIGILKVEIEGILALRHMALSHLTPSSYKLIDRYD